MEDVRKCILSRHDHVHPFSVLGQEGKLFKLIYIFWKFFLVSAPANNVN